MRILSKTGAGTNDALTMTVSVSEDLYRVFFKTGEWNAIVRMALFAGGSYWVEKYLPLRFTNYAKYALGYAHKITKRGAYSAARIAGKLPLVENGDLQNTALSESWVEASANSSNAYAVMHIATGMTTPAPSSKNGASMPYGNQPLVYRTLTTITEPEIVAIAKRAEETIIAMVEGSTGSISRKGTVRRALTPTQRASIPQTRRNPHTPSTQRAV